MITKASLQAYRRQLLEQLALADSMLENFDKLAGVGTDPFESVAGLRAIRSTGQQLVSFPEAPKQPRVRGVLAAVREIVDELPKPFDRNDVMAKLRERDSDLAASVTTANLRNALRLLTRSGDITVQIDATSMSCAKYVSKRNAA